MPVDFAGEPPAEVTISNGSIDCLRVVAPDSSCRWNDFPVRLMYVPMPAAPAPDEDETRQVSSFTTPIPSGGSPTDAQWPWLWKRDILGHVNDGQTLELDIRFSASGSGTVRVVDPWTGIIWSDNFSGAGNFGFVNEAASTPDCFQVGCAGGDGPFVTVFVPFNPLIPIAIANGVLKVRWVGGGSPSGVANPCESLFVSFTPPCDGNLDPNLTVCLESNECGDIVSTWNEVRNAINNDDSGFSATVLNSQGAQFAAPDPFCDPVTGGQCGDDSEGTECLLDGAVCSGGVDFSEGG